MKIDTENLQDTRNLDTLTKNNVAGSASPKSKYGSTENKTIPTSPSLFSPMSSVIEKNIHINVHQLNMYNRLGPNSENYSKSSMYRSKTPKVYTLIKPKMMEQFIPRNEKKVKRRNNSLGA